MLGMQSLMLPLISLEGATFGLLAKAPAEAVLPWGHSHQTRVRSGCDLASWFRSKIPLHIKYAEVQYICSTCVVQV